MPRLYHPGLGREITVPSERAASALRESGWKNAPDPEPAERGKAPEPVTYEPVKPAGKHSKTAAKAARPRTSEED